MDDDLPSKGDSPFPAMEDITVDPAGVAKLLAKLNIHKYKLAAKAAKELALRK